MRHLRRLRPVGPVQVSLPRLLWAHRKDPNADLLPALRRVRFWRLRLWMVDAAVSGAAALLGGAWFADWLDG